MGLLVAFFLTLSNPTVFDMAEIEVESAGDYVDEDREDIDGNNNIPRESVSEDIRDTGQDVYLPDMSSDSMELKLDFITRYQLVECFLLTLCAGALITQVIVHWFTR